MIKQSKNKKEPIRQERPQEVEACPTIGHLFREAVPVWYERSGKVSSTWLSACKEERNQTSQLMDKIASSINLTEACKQVVRNGGSGGVDKMQVKELGRWLSSNMETLQQQLLSNTYRPEAVRGVQIPKPQGGNRQLGIPTVKDRLVQQAIAQVLNQYYEKSFSPYSYGFRPKRKAHQALKQASAYVSAGKTIVVDIDLAKFFDEVNHHRLLWLLSTRIGDKRVIQLINKFLKTGLLQEGLTEQRIKGTPQGSPLSPLLSNIVLDELDQELTRRGSCFVRYADDMQIFVSRTENGERVMRSVTKFIEERMKLKVNNSKSKVQKCYESNFLGHSLLYKGKLGLSKTSETRLKNKLKQITQRKRGVSLETLIHQLKPVLQGWLNYFKYASMKSKMAAIEGWLRRRLKCFRLKQCKRTIGIVRLLRKLKVEEKLCWRTALSGKGWWRLSNSPALNIGMNNQWFMEQGYYSLTVHYQQLHGKVL